MPLTTKPPDAPPRPCHRTLRGRTPWLFGGLLAVQVALFAMAAFLFDLFGHDLLCRYGRARWDPASRQCCCADEPQPAAPPAPTEPQPR